jgi:hypothetical protein
MLNISAGCRPSRRVETPLSNPVLSGKGKALTFDPEKSKKSPLGVDDTRAYLHVAVFDC